MNKKSEEKYDINVRKIVNATARLIQTSGIEKVTVRAICREADISIGKFYYYFNGKEDVIFYFVTKDLSEVPLSTHVDQIVDRQVEIYMNLLRIYQNFGAAFMKSFYSTENMALSAYTEDYDGKFFEGSVLEQSELSLAEAREEGRLKNDADPHQLASDICILIKGSVFEWCLCDGKLELESTIKRLIERYLKQFLV